MYIKIGKIHLIIFLSLFLICTFFSEIAFAEKQDLKEVFIKLNINNTNINSFYKVLTDGNGNIYLPLNSLFQEMELALFNINMKKKTISGMIPQDEDDKVYYFNFKTGEVQKGETKAVIEKGYFVRDDEVYIKHLKLENFLPLKANWNQADFELYIATDFKLLSELRKEREKRRKKLTKKKSQKKAPSYLEEPQFYKPGIIKTEINMDKVSPFLDTEYKGQLFYGLIDLNTSLYPQPKIKDYNLFYEDIYEGYNLDIGNVSIDFPEVLDKKRNLEGIKFINKENRFRFGETVIKGTTIPSSTIELYYKGILIDYQVSEDGNYLFKDLPIKNDVNEFKVLIYKPDGRVEEKEHLVYSKKHLLPPEKTIFKANIGAKDENLYSNLAVNYGLNMHSTIGGELTFLPVEEGTQLFLGGDLFYKNEGQFVSSLNLQLNPRTKGLGYKIDIRNIIKEINCKFNLLGYSNLNSLPRDKIYLDGKLKKLDWESKFELKKGKDDRQIKGEYTLSNYDNYLVHQLSLQKNYRYNLNTFFRLKNNFYYEQDNNWKNELKGEINYRGFPYFDTKVKLSFLNKKSGHKSFSLNSSIRSKKDTSSKFKYSLGQNYNNGDISFYGNLRYNIKEGLSAVATVNDEYFSLALNIKDTRILNSLWTKLDKNSTNTSWVEGIIYLDKNANQKYDPGEKRLDGVEVIVNNNNTTISDSDGHYIVSGLNPKKNHKIKVAYSNLNPLYIVQPESLSFRIRPATGSKINFAVVPGSIISGKLDLSKVQLREINNYRLYLTNQETGERKEIYLEFDGSFVSERVLPGKYILNVRYQGSNLHTEPDNYIINIPPGKPDWYKGYIFNMK